MRRQRTLRGARRIGVAVLGGAVLIMGVLLLVFPGPGLLVIPAGLGILAWEFEAPRRFQQRLLAWLRERSRRFRQP